MKRFISYLLSFCLSISMVFCVSEAGAVFLLISPGAAAQGAGEAQVASAEDAYTSYFNPAGLSFINGDEVLLNWAFENIIKNSLEAITNNKKGVINITIEKNDDSVQIYFSDNGQGIIRKNKKRIFNPGFSTKNRGWGIGLNLSKRIIEHIHNGKLQLHKSKIGETVFKIVLKLSIT